MLNAAQPELNDGPGEQQDKSHRRFVGSYLFFYPALAWGYNNIALYTPASTHSASVVPHTARPLGSRVTGAEGGGSRGGGRSSGQT